MSEWKTYKLGDLIDVQNGYAFKTSDFSDKGMPIIKIKNIVAPRILFDDCEYYEGDVEKRLSQYIIRKGDVLISMTGSHVNQIASAVGKVGKYQFDFPALLNQRVGKIFSKNGDLLSQDYFYYHISRLETQIDLASSASGSANQANISPAQIKELKITVPDLATQTQIAQILSSLDDKIELNLQMNQTLEAMAQALFKEWFVNFNFPSFDGELVDDLPKGWRMGKVGDICLNIRKSFNPSRGKIDVNYIGLEHIPRKSITLLEWGHSDDINSQKSHFIKGDILFGKLRPYFHKVVIAPFEGICSTDILVIRASKDIYQLYSYFHLFSDNCIGYSNSQSDGTRMPRVNWSSLSNYEIPIPPDNILYQFQEIISPVFEKVYSSIFENQTLTQTRDTLLPKLMSGKICLNMI